LLLDDLSKTELRSILAAARAHRERDFLMILIAYSHGLRASEVCGRWATRRVKKQRIKYFHPGICADDIRDGHITVSRLKGSLCTTQPLVSDPDPLFDERKALLAFLASVHGKQRLFPISRQHFWRLVQRYAKAAGIPERKRHPHVLKHTIAMQVIDKTGIQNVRQYLGHKSISSTGAYLKVSDERASSAVQDALRT
jgi:integrase/recombinase XerD